MFALIVIVGILGSFFLMWSGLFDILVGGCRLAWCGVDYLRRRFRKKRVDEYGIPYLD